VVLKIGNSIGLVVALHIIAASLAQANIWQKLAVSQGQAPTSNKNVLLFSSKAFPHTVIPFLAEGLLEIQHSLILKKDDETAQYVGFLIGKKNKEEMIEILSHPRTEVLFLTNADSDALLGYILLTGIHEFHDRFRSNDVGSFQFDNDFLSKLKIINSGTDTRLAKSGVNIDEPIFSELIGKHLTYVYQIGVVHSHSAQGLGKILLDEAKTRYPEGLLAAYLTSPVPNLASRRFFTKNNFYRIGFLEKKAYGVLDVSFSNAVLWTPTAEVLGFQHVENDEMTSPHP
jgi:ribosomal protein S18 acetylase RimI-like enzyme